MSVSVALGIGQAPDGREAAQQASRQALDQIGNHSPTLAIVFVSQEFSVQNAVAGVFAILGTTNIWGIRTSQVITGMGSLSRSVVVAILAGADLKAQVNLYPDYARDSFETAQAVAQSLLEDKINPSLGLLAADGVDGEITQVLSFLSGNDLPPFFLAGCLASNDLRFNQPNVIGGTQASQGALSTVWLVGGIKVGMGFGHGWQPVGAYFTVTSSSSKMLIELDGVKAIEAYSHFLGHSLSEWTQPPLADFIRLYPLGTEKNDQSGMDVFSPVGVKPDGSLRMNRHIPVGNLAHLLAGSSRSIVDIASKIAHEALSALAPVEPVLGLVLMDAAWQTLMAPYGSPEIGVIHSIIGTEVPLIGGYTLGQILRPDLKLPAIIQNQHLLIILFGSEQA